MPEAFAKDQDVPARWRIWAVINGFFLNRKKCWASNEWLGEQIRAHKDTVSQGVKELEDMGVITCERTRRTRLIAPVLSSEIGTNAYQEEGSTPISDRSERLSNSDSISDNLILSVADAPRVVEVSLKEKPEKPTANYKYPHSKEVFALWPSAPKNWALNTTQLRAAENLYEEQGMENIASFLKWYEKHKDEDYCPQVSSPYDLDSKWSKLEAFYDKSHA